jgi:serine/threonine-protein kinase
MDLNSPVALLQALGESGLWSADQFAAGEAVLSQAGPDPAALADRLQNIGPLTAYQARKVKLSRTVDLLCGNYLILEKIGEGGMGKVYKAVHQRIGNTVALKVVRSHLMTNKVVLRRYKREAEAAEKLNHPNIVALHDADVSADRCYLAMEYVEGSDLSRMLKLNGPLPYQEACEYIRQAALGLQYAHERNFIHRDVKPSNLLVSGERALPGTDGKAHVKILDMGLVRSLVEVEEDRSKSELTRDGTVVGTPDYMSPEQAKNSSAVDGRSDVYSLGCTLFYLITGKPPFPDGSPIDKLLRHQLDPPPDLKKLRKEVPLGLVSLVNKTLKKKPEDRFQTAGELAQALSVYTAAAEADLLIAPAVGLPDTLAAPDPVAPLSPAVGIRLGQAGSSIVPMAATVVTTTPTPQPKQKRVLIPIKPAKPIPKPPVMSANDPSSVSIPMMDALTVTPRGTRRPPPKPGARHGSHTANRTPYVIAGAAAGIALLATLVAVAVSGGGNGTKSTGFPPDPAPTPGPALAGPATPAPAVTPVVLLPDGAVAALVSHPQAYWKRAAFDVKPGSHVSDALRRLATAFKFDPRQFDRLVIGWTDTKSDPLTAAGEGDFVTPLWKEGLKGVVRKPAAGNVDSQVPFQYRSEGNPFNRHEPWGVVLGDRTYLIGSESGTKSVARRFADRTNARVDPDLAAALPGPADPDPPFVTFAATGAWTPPHCKKLSEEKVKLLVLTARLGNETIDVRLSLVGPNKPALRDYASIFLATVLREKVPALKPFTDAFTGDPEWDTVGDQVRMTLVGSWPLHDVADWVEELLPGG